MFVQKPFVVIFITVALIQPTSKKEIGSGLTRTKEQFVDGEAAIQYDCSRTALAGHCEEQCHLDYIAIMHEDGGGAPPLPQTPNMYYGLVTD